MSTHTTREAWAETVLAEAIFSIGRMELDRSNFDHPPAISMGYGPGGTRNKRAFALISPDQSTADRWEVFVTPDTKTALDACHAIVCALTCMYGLGLPGLYDATGRTSDEWAAELYEACGEWPHAPTVARPPKQSTRMLKLACDACGWHCRTSTKQIDALPPEPVCPACAAGNLTAK